MSKTRKVSKSVYDDAYDERDKGGFKQDFINWKKCIKNGLSEFEPIKNNRINIIPYVIKSKDHPLVKAGKREVGDLDVRLDIWAHKYLGPVNADVICPKKTYGKPCPVCEEVRRLYDEGKKDDAKKLNASRRTLLNVQPIIQGEAEDLKYWEVSHFLFMKELIEEAHECSEGKDIVPFGDIGDKEYRKA